MGTLPHDALGCSRDGVVPRSVAGGLMYLSSSRAGDAGAQRPTPSARAVRRVAGNVLALGLVSCITDVSSEMVTAVLPLYLVLTLGLTPLQFGFIDGTYAGGTALVRLLGGYL